MDANLLSNKELENYEVEDNFDFKIKGNAIKTFLEFNHSQLDRNKMVVLYGEWGSGKTSLMKHIVQTLNKSIYCPIFFHAWEHEKDENLALSLCDALIKQAEVDQTVIKDFMKGAVLTLKSFVSAFTVKSSGLLSGLGMDAEFSGKEYIKAIDEAFDKGETISFYKENDEFKKSFKEIEKLILKKNNAKRILVFVDDLD